MISVSSKFAEAFNLCMAYYECTEDEINFERERVRANYAQAEVCYLAIAKEITN